MPTPSGIARSIQAASFGAGFRYFSIVLERRFSASRRSMALKMARISFATGRFSSCFGT